MVERTSGEEPARTLQSRVEEETGEGKKEEIDFAQLKIFICYLNYFL